MGSRRLGGDRDWRRHGIAAKMAALHILRGSDVLASFGRNKLRPSPLGSRRLGGDRGGCRLGGGGRLLCCGLSRCSCGTFGVGGASALLLRLRLGRCIRRSGCCKTCFGRDTIFCTHSTFSILPISHATQRCTSAFSSSTVELFWIVQSARAAFSATGICAARRASACSRV